MIWLKRLLPFVVLAAVWFGYDYYQKQRFAAEVSRADHIAQTTARLWLANANLRPDSAAFLAFRDSLLTAEGLTVGGIDSFMAQVRSEPQKYDTFAVMLTYHIDSILHRKPGMQVTDSAGVDTGGVDTTENSDQ